MSLAICHAGNGPNKLVDDDSWSSHDTIPESLVGVSLTGTTSECSTASQKQRQPAMQQRE